MFDVRFLLLRDDFDITREHALLFSSRGGGKEPISLFAIRGGDGVIRAQVPRVWRVVPRWVVRTRARETRLGKGEDVVRVWSDEGVFFPHDAPLGTFLLFVGLCLSRKWLARV